MYIEFQQPPKSSFSCHKPQRINKKTSGHNFNKLCAYVIIPWSKKHDFFDGKCKQLNEDTQFVYKICKLAPLRSFETPQINSCFIMLTYYSTFGP